MIKTKHDCYLQTSCKKCQANNCGEAEEKYCPRISKIDYLFEQALIPIRQRKRFPLRIDADGTDREVFMQLKAVEDNIEQFIGTGSNLFIYFHRH